MRLLLDTHAFLWWLTDHRSLSAAARAAIADPAALVFVSAASIWEISIKASLGRLDLGGTDASAAILACGFLDLPVTSAHAWTAGRLPTHHDDPFDRMLVAQALAEGLTCVTRDDRIASYGVPALW